MIKNPRFFSLDTPHIPSCLRFDICHILVIGANVQVGRAFAELYGQCNVIGTFNSHAESNLLFHPIIYT